jgi:hypothetical protein
MEPVRCPDVSVKNHPSTLRNIPERRRCYQHRGANQESLKAHVTLNYENMLKDT